jgi:hypothetical protein
MPMSAHRGPFVAVTVIAWVLLALAVIGGAEMISMWLDFSHETTCSPVPPTEYRQHQLWGFAVVQGLLILSALGCILGSKRIGTAVGLVLAGVALAIPPVSVMIMIFEIGMC